MTTRRQFVLTALPAVLLAAAAQRAQAQARLEENDPLAVSLGYKHDAAKVDAKKFPAFQAGRNCLNCQLYQGKDAWGACGAVGGKLVNAKGWCVAWVKKA